MHIYTYSYIWNILVSTDVKNTHRGIRREKQKMCIWLPRRWQLGMPSWNIDRGGIETQEGVWNVAVEGGCMSPPCLCERLSTRNIHHFILKAPHQMSSSCHRLATHFKFQNRIYCVGYWGMSVAADKKKHPAEHLAVASYGFVCTSSEYHNIKAVLVKAFLSALSHEVPKMSIQWKCFIQ